MISIKVGSEWERYAGAVLPTKDKVDDYCRMNQNATLVAAAKTALGLPK